VPDLGDTKMIFLRTTFCFFVRHVFLNMKKQVHESSRVATPLGGLKELLKVQLLCYFEGRDDSEGEQMISSA